MSGRPDGADSSRIRSFTRRGSRMPAGHQRAYDAMAPTWVVRVPRAADHDDTTVDPGYRFDPGASFGRDAPLVIEIGSGSGDALRAGARSRPDWDFLGLEVWRPGIGQTLARMRDQPLPNLRLVEVDAAMALHTMFEPAVAAEVWTFFPDPWPKRKHHRRRLVDPALATDVADVLRPGGVWRLATDWAPYGAVMRELLTADERFALSSTDPAPLRPMTRFEAKGLDHGRVIANLNVRRI